MTSVVSIAPLATIVDWHALGLVALASAAIGIAVTLSMALSVVTMLRASDAASEGRNGAAHAQRAASVVFAAITIGILLIGVYEIAS
jgi:hypothetical protein